MRRSHQILIVALFVLGLFVVPTAAARLQPGFLGRSFETDIEIAAPAERVWAVLAALDRYAEWNPFIRSAAGELQEGSSIAVTIQPPGRRAFTFRPRLIAVKPGHELRWLGHVGIPGVFDGEHGFIIEPLSRERVRLVHGEVVRGLLVPFLGGMLRDTERGFHAMNRALKSRVEAEERAANARQ